MAEQSPAANPILYDTPIIRVGREGLNLAKSLDDLTMQEVSRLNNLFHSGGDLTSRLGQTQIATPGVASAVHSVRRMNDPQGATYTRFWGVGTHWYRGQSGPGLAELDAGLSGNPVTFLPVRPKLSGESWMVVADANKMRKARRTGASLPLGLPVPGQPTLVVNAAKQKTAVDFNSTDGSQAANWYVHGGLAVDGSGTYVANPIATDTTAPNGSGVNFSLQIDPAITKVGYWSVAALALALDLSTFTGGDATADEDIIHLLMRIDNPAGVEEIRIYFVVSPFTTGSPLPTIPGAAGNFNAAAYVHSFRPTDYAAFTGNLESAVAAQQAVRDTTLLEGYGVPLVTANDPGANVWTEFGIVGLPVRRGDFLPIGSAGQAGTDWSTVTGIYIVVTTTAAVSVNVSMAELAIRGGYGPDDSEPGSQPYDVRVTNYDPRTGAESNGSTTLADASFVDAVRQSITITPSGVPADGNLLQGFYVRGGSLVDNWYFAGFNASNGAAFTHTLTDAGLSTASTLPVDHFQPVATVDNAGTTVLAQPLPIVFGPFDDGTVCGLGDPYRPGYLYACIAGEIDHWPSTGGYAVEVCSPSEELMNGCLIGGAGFVLSRERGYMVHSNLAGGTGIVATPSGCVPGLAARWGFCVGPGGVYYVARDGIRVTNGGDSTYLSDAIWPLFHNLTVNGFAPIDFSQQAAIRLAVYDTDLWFLYQDTNGTRQCLVFSLIWRYWRPYTFAHTLAAIYPDETQSEQDGQGQLQLILGGTAGIAYTYSGFTDDGTAIPFSLRTGAWHWGRPREEKLLGDIVVEADVHGANLTAQTFLNVEAVTNLAQTVSGQVGRKRYQFDAFGTIPQYARTVSLDLSGTAPITAQVKLAYAGISYAVQPEVTMNRATTWEPMGPTEGYLYACVIDCDTGNSPRTILVEYDLAGVTLTAATLTVTANGRHKLWFSWPVVHAQLVRLRPTGTCEPWLLYNVEWISQPEPPRITGWDSNYETFGDSYYTGLDLECDTFGAGKSVHVFADQTEVAGSPFTVTRNGRGIVHLTLTPGRAHTYRFTATDTNPGLLYAHKWLVEAEPEEQTHWNAPYTVWSSLSDKYLKGIVIEADTFAQDKSVNVEVDGAVLATITPVNHNGRAVKNYTFPQVLGRVFRIIPTDTHPSRLYTAQPIFDEEPFALARWESQLRDFDLPGSGWGSLVSMDVCYRSTAAVTLTVAVYDAQGRLLQTVTGVDQQTGASTLPSTAGAKQKRFVTFPANKGVLFKIILVSADDSGIAVYKEESRLRLQPWSGGQALLKVLGNDDLDATREMTKAAVAAGRSGGAAR